MPEILLKDEVYRLVGCAFEVYNELGCGFLEPVYQEAFELELTEQAIAFARQQPIPIFYQDRPLTRGYLTDLIVIGQIVVELKAEKNLTSRDDAQIIPNRRATKLQVGLWVDFGAHPKLEWKRFVN